MYSYDRTAATTDLRSDWLDAVQKHDRALNEDLKDVLKKAVPYLKSVGYDLDLKRSYLSVEEHGSDGKRMSGALTVTEREENNVQAKDAQAVKQWVASALGIYGFPRKISEGPEKGRDGTPLATWLVEIDES
jgi:hypothetical protein